MGDTQNGRRAPGTNEAARHGANECEKTSQGPCLVRDEVEIETEINSEIDVESGCAGSERAVLAPGPISAAQQRLRGTY